jgi:acyl-coenzyme A thioesterase PaaI-like protein
MSVASSKAILVSPDFKMTMLRGSDSGELRAIARVLKTGGALTFVEVEVVNNTGKSSKLVAKGSFTLLDSGGVSLESTGD